MNSQILAGFIAKTFKDNPHLHDQMNWAYTPPDENIIVSSDANICNTTMCIAGSVQWILNGKEGLKRISGDRGDDEADAAVNEAAAALGLNEKESYTLFNDTTNKEAIEAINALARSKAEFDEYIEDLY